MKLIRNIAGIVILASLTACTNGKTGTVTTTRDYDQNKTVVSETTTTTGLSGKDIVRMEADKRFYDTQDKIADSKSKQFEDVTDPTAQVAIVALEKLAPSRQVGLSSGQIELEKKKENTKRFGIASNYLLPILNFFDRRSSNKTSTGSEGGLVINGDGNQVRGVNTGDNSTFSYREGLEVDPASPSAIEFGEGADGTGTDAFGATCSTGTLEENNGVCPRLTMAKIADNLGRTFILKDEDGGISGNSTALTVFVIFIFAAGFLSGYKFLSWTTNSEVQKFAEAKLELQQKAHEEVVKNLKEQQDIHLEQIAIANKEASSAKDRTTRREREIRSLKRKNKELKMCLDLEVPNATIR